MRRGIKRPMPRPEGSPYTYAWCHLQALLVSAFKSCLIASSRGQDKNIGWLLLSQFAASMSVVGNKNHLKLLGCMHESAICLVSRKLLQSAVVLEQRLHRYNQSINFTVLKAHAWCAVLYVSGQLNVRNRETQNWYMVCLCQLQNRSSLCQHFLLRRHSGSGGFSRVNMRPPSPSLPPLKQTGRTLKKKKKRSCGKKFTRLKFGLNRLGQRIVVSMLTTSKENIETGQWPRSLWQWQIVRQAALLLFYVLKFVPLWYLLWWPSG